MQQSVVNLFADMGVQPATLQSGLTPATASVDKTPPTSTVLSPNSGSTQQLGVPVTVSGSAVDTGGGVVAAVEISACPTFRVHTQFFGYGRRGRLPTAGAGTPGTIGPYR
jgi:hypothetical protein